MTATADIRSHQKAFLLALEGPGDAWKDSLAELSRLAETAHVEVVDAITQKRDRPDPVQYIGKGKAQEIRVLKGELGADLLLVDAELRPSQQRNLEETTNMGVVDRTGLILDIFAQRARSAEGKIQVELAQLNYLLPRLTGKGVELSRLGGGIGTRGPGETKLETDRRRVRKRIRLLRKQVEQIGKRRALERRHRHQSGLPVIALVGYTNAGKSTLLNAFSDAGVFVEDLLFATLDPTVRRIELPRGRQALMVDTVGFIRNLPTQLVAAFRATLEEVVEADLLLHVVDASHPQWREQIQAAQRVLADLDCADKTVIMAFNKMDLVDDKERLAETIGREERAIAVSALTGDGLNELLAHLAERLEQELVPVEVKLPWDAQELVSEAHERGRVLSERFDESGVALTARVPPDVAEKLRHAAGLKPERTEDW